MAKSLYDFCIERDEFKLLVEWDKEKKRRTDAAQRIQGQQQTGLVEVRFWPQLADLRLYAHRAGHGLSLLLRQVSYAFKYPRFEIPRIGQ